MLKELRVSKLYEMSDKEKTHIKTISIQIISS
jgi:hypothetical protein